MTKKKSVRHIVKHTGLPNGYRLVIGLQFSIFILIEMLVCALNFSLFFPPQFGNKFITHYRIFLSEIGYFVFIIRILAMSPFSPLPYHLEIPLSVLLPHRKKKFPSLQILLIFQQLDSAAKYSALCVLLAFLNTDVGRKWNDKKWERGRKKKKSFRMKYKEIRICLLYRSPTMKYCTSFSMRIAFHWFMLPNLVSVESP